MMVRATTTATIGSCKVSPEVARQRLPFPLLLSRSPLSLILSLYKLSPGMGNRDRERERERAHLAHNGICFRIVRGRTRTHRLFAYNRMSTWKSWLCTEMSDCAALIDCLLCVKT